MAFLAASSLNGVEPIPGMAVWREKLFSAMQHNAERPAASYCIPAARVTNAGTEIAI